MFNKTTIHKHETKVVPITRVVEKSVSPDKISEIYKEVREEVEMSIVKSMVVKDNNIEGIVVEIHNRYEDRTTKVYTCFSLNGEKYTDVTSLPTLQDFTDEQLYTKFSEHFRLVVQNKIMKEAAMIVLGNRVLNHRK